MQQREMFFNNEVIDIAEYYGWRTFHLRDRDSIHIVRGRGFPDLVMFRKNPETGVVELVAAELKRDADSVTTPEQDEWLEALGHHIPAYTWRPEDWPEIEHLLENGPAGQTKPRQPEINPNSSPIPANFGNIITNIIEAIESKEMTIGEKAGLRRMDPLNPEGAVFWKLISQRGMSQNLDIVKWGLIIHGIALMSHTAGLAHNPRRPVGRVLYEGKGDNNIRNFYSETRLNRLLTARGTMLQVLLARLFRILANERCAFDWREMARFILNVGYDEESAERSRHYIARAYYRAERHNYNQSGE